MSLESYILVGVKTYMKLKRDVWEFRGRADILTEGFIKELTLYEVGPWRISRHHLIRTEGKMSQVKVKT